MRDLLSKIDAIILNESALNPANPKADYHAKRKALHDLELDPMANKDPEILKAISQRILDLEKEAKAKGVKEGVDTDHEATMARAELAQIAKNAMIIYKLIHEGQNLDGWISSYITLANDHLNSVAEKMEYEHSTSEFGEGVAGDLAKAALTPAIAKLGTRGGVAAAKGLAKAGIKANKHTLGKAGNAVMNVVGGEVTKAAGDYVGDKVSQKWNDFKSRKLGPSKQQHIRRAK